MSKPKRVVQVRDADHAELERLVRSRTAEKRLSERERIVLASSEGMSSRQICHAFGVSHPTVARWLNRYEAQGLSGLRQDFPRSGRPKRITPEQVAEVVSRNRRRARGPTGARARWPRWSV